MTKIEKLDEGYCPSEITKTDNVAKYDWLPASTDQIAKENRAKINELIDRIEVLRSVAKGHQDTIEIFNESIQQINEKLDWLLWAQRKQQLVETSTDEDATAFENFLREVASSEKQDN